MPNKDIHSQYEKQLEKLIKAYSKRIQNVYYSAINEISLYSALAPSTQLLLNQTVLDAFPALKIKLDQIMQQVHDGIYQTVATSINDAWALSNKKNDTIADDLVGDMNLAAKVKDLVYNPNADALEAFLKRKSKGLNLSDRVWNLVEPYKFELEAGLQDGISKGKSAASMATDLKRSLNEPEKLFRRVRDENGKLQLSRSAQAYHPGTGVYRSSYKNALRLTATETNISYKSSDHERWKRQPFTKGFEVRTSNNHPLLDICDFMAGEYPVTFKFTSWHPNCRCTAIPILVSDEEFDKQEDFLLGLSNSQPKIERVQEMPTRAKEWVKDNAKRIKGWSNVPYFVKDNHKFVKPLLNTKK